MTTFYEIYLNTYSNYARSLCKNSGPLVNKGQIEKLLQMKSAQILSLAQTKRVDLTMLSKDLEARGKEIVIRYQIGS